uniref:GNAT family N-acetyltransferase n=1 Tax=Gelidibacter sp. TaxID=2018083 RepID=UPI00404A3EE3
MTDSESISDLSNQLGYHTNTIDIQSRLFDVLKHPDNCVYVIVTNEKVVGWIHGFYTLRVESAAFIEIGGLVVDKNFRKMGIGKLLVEKIYEWAESKECNKIRVRCNEVRIESHLFYDNLGFKLNKVQKIFSLEL